MKEHLKGDSRSNLEIFGPSKKSTEYQAVLIGLRILEILPH